MKDETKNIQVPKEVNLADIAEWAVSMRMDLVEGPNGLVIQNLPVPDNVVHINDTYPLSNKRWLKSVCRLTNKANGNVFQCDEQTAQALLETDKPIAAGMSNDSYLVMFAGKREIK